MTLANNEIVFLLNDKNDQDITMILLMLVLRKQYCLPLPAQQIMVLYERGHHFCSFCGEEWITKYLNEDFFLRFRMCKETFHKLLPMIQCKDLDKPFHGGGIPLTSEKALLITLWWLGKGESLISIGDRFNLVPSTVHHYTNVVLNQLIQLISKYIQWPNCHEMVTIQTQFSEICGYPGVIGAIDGCNINFKAPIDQQESYIDKNGKHSIKIQAVTTALKLFTNINVGFPGSVHDSRVFTNSQLYVDTLYNIRKYFPLEEYHLLGDKAYPIQGWLMTPYREYGNLTRRQKIHNLRHSKTRIKVEHTFGIWKGRWRILQYINVNCPRKACKIIAACCVLHNFCYLNHDQWDDVDGVENENDEEHDVYMRNENVGILKRENISMLFE